jgi:copper transport protein
VSLFVEPARTGANTLHLTLRSPDFGADVYDTVAVRATLASQDIGPLDIALEPAGTNHFTAKAAQFPAAGKWAITVAVLVSEFDRRVFTLNVRIRP